MDGIFGGKNVPVNVREFQWKTFTPMQLNMDGWGANPKYPHILGEPATSINRSYLKLKSMLMPYAYTIAHEAIDGKPMIRAMFLDYPNDYALGNLSWHDLGKADIVAPGTQLNEPELLFEKIEDDAIQAQLDRLAAIKEQNRLKAWQPEPQAAPVDFDTFLKLDIRVGKVLECAKVPKADKLLQFRIDDGMGGRTIVSGIAKYYAPEDLVGKEVCFVANFAPRKLKGIESQGMILSAENADGRLVVIGPHGEVKPGAQVK